MIGSPKIKINIESLEDVTVGMVNLTRKLVKHAEKHPMASNRDVSEVKGVAKLALEVSSQLTSDPYFMAKIVEDMDKKKVSALNEWLHLNKTMGR